MLKTSLPLCLCAAALTLGAASRVSPDNAATAQSGEAQEPPENRQSQHRWTRTAASSRRPCCRPRCHFGRPGPYTVLVPSDEAFAGLEERRLSAIRKPSESRRDHAHPDLSHSSGRHPGRGHRQAIDNGEGRAVLATMGGETLTATRRMATLSSLPILRAAGRRSAQADEKDRTESSTRIDAVLMPPERTGRRSNQPAG
jgi:hypothetical protein